MSRQRRPVMIRSRSDCGQRGGHRWELTPSKCFKHRCYIVANTAISSRFHDCQVAERSKLFANDLVGQDEGVSTQYVDVVEAELEQMARRKGSPTDVTLLVRNKT